MRVKGGTVTRARRKKMIKLAKGYRGQRHINYKVASNKFGSHGSMHSVTVSKRSATSVSCGLHVLTLQHV